MLVSDKFAYCKSSLCLCDSQLQCFTDTEYVFHCCNSLVYVQKDMLMGYGDWWILILLLCFFFRGLLQLVVIMKVGSEKRICQLSSESPHVSETGSNFPSYFVSVQAVLTFSLSFASLTDHENWRVLR